MKLVTWNVNGLRACMNKGFKESMEKLDADIISIQETKMQREQASFDFPGYYEYWNSAVKKGYSGTAIFSRIKPLSVTYGLGIEEHDQEGRVITAEYDDFYLVNVYTPNSQRELARLAIAWLGKTRSRRTVRTFPRRKTTIVCGDMNVAHEPIDLKNPDSNHHNAGFSDEERQKLDAFLARGFVDSFRMLYPDGKGPIPGGRICSRPANGMRGGALIISLFQKPVVTRSGM